MSLFVMNYSSGGYTVASCIGLSQKLVTTDGVVTAGQLHMQAKAGHSIEFPQAGKLVISGRTRTAGVIITFDDGVTLELTEGHRILVYKRKLAKHAKIHGVVPAGLVRVGDNIQGRTVTAIERVPEMDAIRVFGSIPPGYLRTPEGIAIGTRWHEILLSAWIPSPGYIARMRAEMNERGWWDDQIPYWWDVDRTHFEHLRTKDHERKILTPSGLEGMFRKKIENWGNESMSIHQNAFHVIAEDLKIGFRDKFAEGLWRRVEKTCSVGREMEIRESHELREEPAANVAAG